MKSGSVLLESCLAQTTENLFLQALTTTKKKPRASLSARDQLQREVCCIAKCGTTIDCKAGRDDVTFCLVSASDPVFPLYR